MADEFESTELQKFHALVARFDTAMLITHAGNDRMHGRPMAIAQVEDTGDLWFLSGMDTPKLDEIRSNGHVLVSFQDNGARFLSISGRAELVKDRQKVDEIWKEPFKAWFPQGKDDPNLILIHVRSQQAEYWDNAGANKVTYALDALRAYVTGDTPNVPEGAQHGRLNV